jgi:glutaredoxin
MPKITIYSKENCSYCTKAILLAQEKGLAVTEIKLGRDLDRDTFLATLKEKIGKLPETAPQIFMGEDDEYVGGYTEFAARYAS